MEVSEYKGPIFRGKVFHGIHANRTIEDLMVSNLLQTHFLEWNPGKFRTGTVEHALGLIDPKNGMPLVQQEWHIPASPASCIKDPTIWREKAQEFLYELLMHKVAIDAPLLIIKRSFVIILFLAITSQFFEPGNSVHFNLSSFNATANGEH